MNECHVCGNTDQLMLPETILAVVMNVTSRPILQYRTLTCYFFPQKLRLLVMSLLFSWKAEIYSHMSFTCVS